MPPGRAPARGEAVQVEHIMLTLDLKPLGFQLLGTFLKVKVLSTFWLLVSTANLHPCITASAHHCEMVAGVMHVYSSPGHGGDGDGRGGALIYTQGFNQL